ncbi:hypothetical protein ACP70R_002810 [Stipagrostis hirtigluma subsp. patula]
MEAVKTWEVRSAKEALGRLVWGEEHRAVRGDSSDERIFSFDEDEKIFNHVIANDYPPSQAASIKEAFELCREGHGNALHAFINEQRVEAVIHAAGALELLRHLLLVLPGIANNAANVNVLVRVADRLDALAVNAGGRFQIDVTNVCNTTRQLCQQAADATFQDLKASVEEIVASVQELLETPCTTAL